MAAILIASVRFIKLRKEKKNDGQRFVSSDVYYDGAERPDVQAGEICRLHPSLQVRRMGGSVEADCYQNSYCIIRQVWLLFYIYIWSKLLRYMHWLLDDYLVEALSILKENEHANPHDNKPP